MKNHWLNRKNAKEQLEKLKCEVRTHYGCGIMVEENSMPVIDWCEPPMKAITITVYCPCPIDGNV